MRKVNAKHKLRFKHEDANKYHHKMTFGSVRNKVLQKLLLVDHLLWVKNSWLHKELAERYKDHNQESPGLLARKFSTKEETGEVVDDLMPCELMYYLGPGDIMKVIGYNRRTAAGYRDVLSSIHSDYERVFY
jgi:hypothetical protein